MKAFKSVRMTTGDRLFPNNPEESIRKGELVLGYRYVSPEDAKEYLRITNTHNRNVRTKWAKKLAQLMIDNRWHEGVPNMLAFAYEGGSWILLDKQHTLQAIVLSGKGQFILIGWCFPLAAQQVIDQTAKRSVTDVLRLIGELLAVPNTNPKLVGEAVQATWMGGDASIDRLQVGEVLDFINLPTSRPALRFVLEKCITRRVSHCTLAPVVGAFVRAYMCWNLYREFFANKCEFQERMRLAGLYLMNGPTGDFRAKTDNAITRLRDRISKHAKQGGYAGVSMGRGQRREVYFLACGALDAFLKGRQLNRVQLPKNLPEAEDPYPLPSAIANEFRTELDVTPTDLIRPILYEVVA